MRRVKTRTPFKPAHRMWMPYAEYCDDPWSCFTDTVQVLKDRGANFLTMWEAYNREFDPGDINVVLDHHIDHYPLEMHIMLEWERAKGVRSSAYVFNRVIGGHKLQEGRNWGIADLDVRHLANLEKDGFEIGYHQNAVGQALAVRGLRKHRDFVDESVLEDAKRRFQEDVESLSRFFTLRTFIPHGASEGNVLLTDLPEKGGGLLWAYNGRTGHSDIGWENFNDSSGLRPKILKARRAHYVVHRAPWLFKAYTARKGLHHLLMHPGRFGRGMPYSEVVGTPMNGAGGGHLAFEAPHSLNGLPIDVRAITSNWLRGVNRDLIAVESWQEVSSAILTISDSIEPIARWLTKSSRVVPVYCVEERLPESTREGLRGSEDDPRRYPSRPSQGEGGARVKFDRWEYAFLRQFKGFINWCYTADLVRHLMDCDIPYREIVLRNVRLLDESSERRLDRMIKNYLGSASVDLLVEVGEGLDLKSIVNRWSGMGQIELVDLAGGRRGLRFRSSPREQVVAGSGGERSLRSVVGEDYWTYHSCPGWEDLVSRGGWGAAEESTRLRDVRAVVEFCDSRYLDNSSLRELEKYAVPEDYLNVVRANIDSTGGAFAEGAFPGGREIYRELVRRTASDAEVMLHLAQEDDRRSSKGGAGHGRLGDWRSRLVRDVGTVAAVNVFAEGPESRWEEWKCGLGKEIIDSAVEGAKGALMSLGASEGTCEWVFTCGCSPQGHEGDGANAAESLVELVELCSEYALESIGRRSGETEEDGPGQVRTKRSGEPEGALRLSSISEVKEALLWQACAGALMTLLRLVAWQGNRSFDFGSGARFGYLSKELIGDRDWTVLDVVADPLERVPHDFKVAFSGVAGTVDPRGELFHEMVDVMLHRRDLFLVGWLEDRGFVTVPTLAGAVRMGRV